MADTSLFLLSVVLFVAAIGGFLVWRRRRLRRRPVVDGLFFASAVLGALCLCFWGWVLVILYLERASTIADPEPCTATVLSLAEGSARINGRDTYLMELRVRPEGGAPYRLTVDEPLSSVAAGRVGAGVATFPCVVDRQDRTRLEVFWLDDPEAAPTAP
ncbi:hypothetical protein [Streptomyces sp. JJ38]|uniref:hypothetical protein n=1 Tax=Streptomyces sp. JJ38 TaxID=2738128 RepID=UPI001C57FB90|nr:hypothetical protein [Streptomyces sp. JJ38]MBW1597441.1 hypothetical protein [Streptomyces sp. JJ38]